MDRRLRFGLVGVLASVATADTAIGTAAHGTARFIGNTFDAADDELD